jgi:hypothetical protein
MPAGREKGKDEFAAVYEHNHAAECYSGWEVFGASFRRFDASSSLASGSPRLTRPSPAQTACVVVAVPQQPK